MLAWWTPIDACWHASELMNEKSIEVLFLESQDPNLVIYRGRELVHLDRFPLLGHQKLRVVFEETNSDIPQAVRLQSDLPIEIDRQKGNNIVLWVDTVPSEVVLVCSPE